MGQKRREETAGLDESEARHDERIQKRPSWERLPAFRPWRSGHAACRVERRDCWNRGGQRSRDDGRGREALVVRDVWEINRPNERSGWIYDGLERVDDHLERLKQRRSDGAWRCRRRARCMPDSSSFLCSTSWSRSRPRDLSCWRRGTRTSLTETWGVHCTAEKIGCGS